MPGGVPRKLSSSSVSHYHTNVTSIVMSTPNEQPECSGKLSTESQPQVVVRAGKYYVCSACGTMVEIPADVVGQLVFAVDPSPQAHDSPQREPQPSDPPEPASMPAQPSSPVSTHHSGGRARPVAHTTQATKSWGQDTATVGQQQHARPPRPRRPKAPQRPLYAGQTIDGLVVPTASSLDRAIAWVTFHLTVLDRQGNEFNRLKKLLKNLRRQQQQGSGTSHRSHNPSSGTKNKQQVLSPRPGRHRKNTPIRKRAGLLKRNQRSHAHADARMAPRLKTFRTRSRRIAPSVISRRQLRTSKRIQGRGPP